MELESLGALPDLELKTAVREALDWWQGEALPGETLRAIAGRLQRGAAAGGDGLLRIAADLVCQEAARRFAMLGPEGGIP